MTLMGYAQECAEQKASSYQTKPFQVGLGKLDINIRRFEKGESIPSVTAQLVLPATH